MDEKTYPRTTLTWTEWCAELQRVAEPILGKIDDLDSWHDYYRDGFTPRGAISEDASYG